MSLASEVAAVLLGNTRQVDRIHFRIGRVAVDPGGMREVGRKIRDGKIRVERAHGRAGGLLAASYTPALNKLSLDEDLDLEDVIGQGAVVHESTHALIDLRRYHTTEAMDEMAAYIAESIFMLASHRTGSSPDADSRRILEAAQAIVRRKDLINAQGATVLGFDDYKDLDAAIHAHPSYRATADNEVRGDGV